MDFKTLIYEKKGRKAIITMNRPNKQNSITYQMAAELGEAWGEVGADPDVWVAIVTGAGDEYFTTGVDHDEVDPAQVLKKGSLRESPTGRMTPRRAGIWKPVIAAVNGVCTADGGWAIAMDCDVIIASENALFWDEHVQWGSVIGTESTGMARRMPFGEIMRLVLTSGREKMTAQRAYQIGLVSEVTPKGQVMQAAERLADRIAQNSPKSVQGSAQVLWQGLEIGGRQASIDNAVNIITRNQMTEDYKAGHEARVQRRKPTWKNR